MPTEPASTASQAVRGVFATETTTSVGFGATKRRVKQTIYVYAEEAEDGMMACRSLSSEFIPQGNKRMVSREDLLKKFVPAPHIYLNKVLPALAALEQAVDSAERCRKEGQLFTAEFEFKNALRLDEDHIRASFGLGLTYLDRGDPDNADIVFRKLSRVEGASDPEYKHLFNEFGIKLRRNHMYHQALSHYGKALRLSPDDDHLRYNLARALFEKGRLRAALRSLDKALAVRPDFKEALEFRRRITEMLTTTILDDTELSPGAADGKGISPEKP
ncbi:MAG: tetratricopeptide repeat protein [Acidobacteriota bacterium]